VLDEGAGVTYLQAVVIALIQGVTEEAGGEGVGVVGA
jgi:hypothetical protein